MKEIVSKVSVLPTTSDG